MNPLEGKTKVEIEQLLQDYIATVNNPRYKGNMNVINSKFPEFQGMDVQLLQDYIATYNNPDYSGNYAVINSKFPEFFAGVKKKRPTTRRYGFFFGRWFFGLVRHS